VTICGEGHGRRCGSWWGVYLCTHICIYIYMFTHNSAAMTNYPLSRCLCVCVGVCVGGGRGVSGWGVGVYIYA